ncbi:MAG: hypothetical protein ABIJ03_03185 [Patescibacteria group bacterium]
MVEKNLPKSEDLSADEGRPTTKGSSRRRFLKGLGFVGALATDSFISQAGGRLVGERNQIEEIKADLEPKAVPHEALPLSTTDKGLIDMLAYSDWGYPGALYEVTDPRVIVSNPSGPVYSSIPSDVFSQPDSAGESAVVLAGNQAFPDRELSARSVIVSRDGRAVLVAGKVSPKNPAISLGKVGNEWSNHLAQLPFAEEITLEGGIGGQYIFFRPETGQDNMRRLALQPEDTVVFVPGREGERIVITRRQIRGQSMGYNYGLRIITLNTSGQVLFDTAPDRQLEQDQERTVAEAKSQYLDQTIEGQVIDQVTLEEESLPLSSRVAGVHEYVALEATQYLSLRSGDRGVKNVRLRLIRVVSREGAITSIINPVLVPNGEHGDVRLVGVVADYLVVRLENGYDKPTSLALVDPRYPKKSIPLGIPPSAYDVHQTLDGLQAQVDETTLTLSRDAIKKVILGVYNEQTSRERWQLKE